jgi:hypothetical protein
LARPGTFFAPFRLIERRGLPSRSTRRRRSAPLRHPSSRAGPIPMGQASAAIATEIEKEAIDDYEHS